MLEIKLDQNWLRAPVTVFTGGGLADVAPAAAVLALDASALPVVPALPAVPAVPAAPVVPATPVVPAVPVVPVVPAVPLVPVASSVP